MVSLRFYFFAFIFSLFSTEGYSQKMVAFNKLGKVKRVKYYEGDYIVFRTKTKEKHAGNLQEIKDSTFIVNHQEFHLAEINKVINTQKNAGFYLLYKVAIRGGYIYAPIVMFNRLINNDNPILSKPTLFISGVMLGVALISHMLRNKPYKISKKRPLKIIDITP